MSDEKPGFFARIDPAALGALILALVGLICSAYLGYYRVGQLETWKQEHLATIDKSRMDYDGRLLHLEEFGRDTSNAHGIRLSILEERYSAILGATARIEQKLDELSAKKH